MKTEIHAVKHSRPQQLWSVEYSVQIYSKLLDDRNIAVAYLPHLKDATLMSEIFANIEETPDTMRFVLKMARSAKRLNPDIQSYGYCTDTEFATFQEALGR